MVMGDWAQAEEQVLRHPPGSGSLRFFFFFFFCLFAISLLLLLLLFPGPLPRHMEVPRLGVESEL